jgi:hypothetical protein
MQMRQKFEYISTTTGLPAWTRRASCSGEVMSEGPGRIASQIAPKTTRSIATVAASAGTASDPTGARTMAIPATVGIVTARTRSRKL